MEHINAKIKELRLARDLTLQGLADRCGLSVGFLSQVERGNSSLTITSLQRIAEGLDVPITMFFETTTNTNFTVKASEQRPFSIEGSDVVYTRLAGNFPGRTFEPMIVELPANHRIENVYSHPGEEFYHVLEGTVCMNVAGTDYLLREGDSIHFPSTVEHYWENPSGARTRLLCVLHPLIF